MNNISHCLTLMIYKHGVNHAYIYVYIYYHLGNSEIDQLKWIFHLLGNIYLLIDLRCIDTLFIYLFITN